ncbi:MAG: lytic transglycosylase domain-containing protein, partial [Mesorhizobium sp.]
MQKLTVLTAALAAGVMTFAFNSANAAPFNPRADQGFVAVSAKSGKAGHDAKATKRASAKAE